MMCPAFDFGITTDSNFGKADVLDESYDDIKACMKPIKKVPIVTGFIGKDKNGDVTTLGRGGSDYTAAIYGAALDAEEIQIWTDVCGVMTADPTVIRKASSSAKCMRKW